MRSCQMAVVLPDGGYLRWRLEKNVHCHVTPSGSMHKSYSHANQFGMGTKVQGTVIMHTLQNGEEKIVDLRCLKDGAIS